MMISPDGYADMYRGKTYKDLIKEIDILIREVRRFEKGKISYNEMMRHPSADVVYQMNLRYLSEICKLIADEYNREFEWQEFDEKEKE
ncbi:MAG: hypothetical protein IKE18_04365 [Oscillospiraceae bacterium]|nr:hypothetical protein [Oscillospiraceae bacterium]